MSKTIKTTGFLIAVSCFALCMAGAVDVHKNAQDVLWKGVGLFLIGASFFVGSSLIMLTSLLGRCVSQKSAGQSGVGTAANRPASKTAPKSAAAISADASVRKPAQRAEKSEKEAVSEKKSANEGPANVYIGNLAPVVSEADLRAEFDAFGQVRSVRIIADKDTGESKGYAFVEMLKKSDALNAIEKIDGQDIKGQTVKAMIARPKPRSRRN